MSLVRLPAARVGAGGRAARRAGRANRLGPFAKDVLPRSEVGDVKRSWTPGGLRRPGGRASLNATSRGHPSRRSNARPGRAWVRTAYIRLVQSRRPASARPSRRMQRPRRRGAGETLLTPQRQAPRRRGVACGRYWTRPLVAPPDRESARPSGDVRRLRSRPPGDTRAPPACLVDPRAHETM